MFDLGIGFGYYVIYYVVKGYVVIGIDGLVVVIEWVWDNVCKVGVLVNF